MVDAKSEIERIQIIARTVQRALIDQEAGHVEPGRARIVSHQEDMDIARPINAKPLDAQQTPTSARTDIPKNEKKINVPPQSEHEANEKQNAKTNTAEAPVGNIRTDLDQLSHHLKNVLAKLRQPHTAYNPSISISARQTEPPPSRAPQISKVINKLHKQLHQLEDEAEKTRLAILDELGRFDSQQRKILAEAEAAINHYEEQGSSWLTIQRSEIKAERAELKRISNLVEALARTKSTKEGLND